MGDKRGSIVEDDGEDDGGVPYLKKRRSCGDVSSIVRTQIGIGVGNGHSEFQGGVG